MRSSDVGINMDSNEITYLHQLIMTHTNRVRILELKAAQFGLNCPPEIQTEINDINNKIRELTRRLGNSYDPSFQSSSNHGINLIRSFIYIFIGFAMGAIFTWSFANRIASRETALDSTFRINITDLEVVSGKNYRISRLKSGKQPYIDRSYTYINFPIKLEDKPYIVTANDDKFSQNNTFIKFNIDHDAMIYVAHNDCYTEKPTWLSQFQDTGESVAMTSAEVTLATYSLYARKFSAGSILLGGNVVPEEIQECGMYSVIISDN